MAVVRLARWALTAILLASVCSGSGLLTDATLYGVLPMFYQTGDLWLTPLQVGILLSANRYVRIFTNHLGRLMTTKLGPIVTYPASLAFGVLCSLILGFSNTFWLLLVSRCIWGFSWSLIRHNGLLVAKEIAKLENASTASKSAKVDTDIFQKEKEGQLDEDAGKIGRAVGIYEGVSRVGAMAGNIGGSALGDLYGFHFPFRVLGFAQLICVPIAYSLVRRVQSLRMSTASSVASQPSTASKSTTISIEKEPTIDAADSSSEIKMAALQRAFDFRSLAWLAMINMTAMMIISGILGVWVKDLYAEYYGLPDQYSTDTTISPQSFSPVNGTEESSEAEAVIHQAPATLNGLLLGGRWVVEVFLGPFIGALYDRHKERVMLPVLGSSVLLLVVNGVLFGFRGALFAVLPRSVVAILFCVVVVVFFGSTVCARVMLLSKASSYHGDSNIATFVSFMDVGSACGPLMAWVAIELLISIPMVFYAMALLETVFILWLIVWPIRRETGSFEMLMPSFGRYAEYSQLASGENMGEELQER